MIWNPNDSSLNTYAVKNFVRVTFFVLVHTFTGKPALRRQSHFSAWCVALTPAPTPEPGFGQGLSECLLIESVAKSRRSMISNERSWAFAQTSARQASAEVVAQGIPSARCLCLLPRQPGPGLLSLH